MKTIPIRLSTESKMRAALIMYRRGLISFWRALAMAWLGCLLIITVGCKFNSSGWPIIPFMNNGNSQRASGSERASQAALPLYSAPSIMPGFPYAPDPVDEWHLRNLIPKRDPWGQKEFPVELPRALLSTLNLQPSTSEDDCGACNTNPTTQYVLGPHIQTLEWDQPGGCTGWNIEESPAPAVWYRIGMIWSFGKTNGAYRFVSTNNPTRWRVAAYQ